MDELIKKIIALRDLAKSLTAKPGSNNLVPAIKPPSPKPLSLPSKTGAAPTKLPGVAVPSGKDPKAMAAQLKNPRPTKPPKIEVLKADKNGQWYLEKGAMQRIAPMSQKQNKVYQADIPNVLSWTSLNNPEARESMKRLEGPARTRGLHKLHSLTQSRLNPDTNEREFLLHRGMSFKEHKEHKGGIVNNKTSWTPHYEMAQAFQGSEDDPENLGETISAWVPEQHIHHIPNAIGHDNEKIGAVAGIKPEHEVIISPHKLNIHKTTTDK